MSSPSPTPPSAASSRERADLIASLDKHRGFLRYTADGLTDEQASTRTTVSALTVGGLIRHVSEVEAQWVAFIEHGPDAFPAFDADWDPGSAGADDAGEDIDWESGFRLAEGQTLADALATYDAVAARTDELVATVPDLDADHPLPVAPWFEAGARWSVRRTVLHIIAETAQHAGHADIIRESLDGQKTMG
jgi:hypothetical protein